MAGITKIKIPVRRSELTIEAVKPYLENILTQFEDNKGKIEKYWNIYQNKHDIESKIRKYEEDNSINNKVSTPHLWSIVNFKSGYALGNPKEYAQTSDSQTDDIKYLNKFVKSANLRTIDKNVATSIYATGIGHYFIEPKSENFDIESEAPFNIYWRESNTCTKVYSSYNGEEPLLDILFTTYKKIEKQKEREVTLLSIYLPDNYYEFEYDSLAKISRFKEIATRSQARPIYKKLPLVEKYANESRIGVVEIGKTLQDAIDNIYSNEVDNVEDLVNEMLIFKNCSLGNTPEEKSETLQNARKNGAIEINDKNPDIPADVKTISTKLNHADILTLLESMKNELYATSGTPIAVSDTSNGGNKQGALQLGNGWENAYNRLLDEINSFLIADYDLLDKMLFIASKSRGSKLNELKASEIEIKYNPNMTDNMVSKSQAYQTFIACGVPADLAIAWCRLSNDPVTASKRIEEYKAQLLKEQKAQEGINGDSTNNINDSEVVKTQN